MAVDAAKDGSPPPPPDRPPPLAGVPWEVAQDKLVGGRPGAGRTPDKGAERRSVDVSAALGAGFAVPPNNVVRVFPGLTKLA